MKRPPIDKELRDVNVLVRAAIAVISSLGSLYPAPIRPIRYPHSYGQDLEAIGRDMWKAAGKITGNHKPGQPREKD